MENDTHSFILRIWYESVNREGKVVTWRGHIDHVGNDKRFYFRDLDEVARFIKEELGLNAGRPASRWRSVLAWIRRVA